MQPRDAISTAQEAVHNANLPPELQVAAFSEVLRHLLEAGPANTNGVNGPAGLSAIPAESSALHRLAARVGVGATALADVFEITENTASLHVASSRIAQSKSRATKDVALLIAAARQGSGIDDAWTGVQHVRETLQDYKRYDTNNFSANLRQVADAFNFRGKGAGMEMRLTKLGWETATALIHSLVE